MHFLLHIYIRCTPQYKKYDYLNDEIYLFTDLFRTETMLLLELQTDTFIFLYWKYRNLHVCVYIYIMYNDEKNFADNYLRCLPVVLGTAFVRRTLQETSVHNELKLQIKVCCLSTTFRRQRRPHLNSLPLFLP